MELLTFFYSSKVLRLNKLQAFQINREWRKKDPFIKIKTLESYSSIFKYQEEMMIADEKHLIILIRDYPEITIFVFETKSCKLIHLLKMKTLLLSRYFISCKLYLDANFLIVWNSSYTAPDKKR